jgi:hypothetical protein
LTGVVAVAVLSACQGSSTGGAGASSPGGPGGSNAPTNAPAGGTGGGAGGGSRAGTGTTLASCTAADLKADLNYQPEVTKAGLVSWMLAVTNTSGRSCHLYGHPSFGLQDGSGSLLADSHTSYTAYPGAAISITLRPGNAAFAGVKWDACPQGDLIGGLVMTPPGQRQHVTVHVLNGDGSTARWRLCGHSVTAGTFQPATQGVVFTS